MDFLELEITCDPDFFEILTAEFSGIGFDSFREDENSLFAYAEPPASVDEEILRELLEKYAHVISSVDKRYLARENWNSVWESNYPPVYIEDRCVIRATFHDPEPGYPLQVIINPKMSFGTGHHATTWLMAKFLLETELSGKKVLDVGCGTGILSVISSLLGAREVDGIDIEEWAVENSIENCQLNQCGNVRIFQSDIRRSGLTGPYDILLANINRNILIDEAVEYSNLLSTGGRLYISGIYETDMPDLRNAFAGIHLSELKFSVRNQWSGMIFEKTK